MIFNLAIRKCTSPPLQPRGENLLPGRGSNPGPAEPEADMLPSEPARRAVEASYIIEFCVTVATWKHIDHKSIEVD